ncbi:MAG TPA: M56 family metallopeptidase [Vicinamibacterales bacterium]|jgi:Zn-dependent protease with chaperone function
MTMGRLLPAFLAQSILHGLIAAVFVETVLRAWRVEDASWRVRLRFLPLLFPIVALPVLFLLAPWRNDPSFIGRRALFASERWNLLHVSGVGLGDLVLLLAAGLGAALFLRDAVPPILDLLRAGHRAADVGPWLAGSTSVTTAVETHARVLGIAPPPVRVIRLTAPVLLCEGARRPTLVISPSTMARLPAAELNAALAHELAHAAYRDPAWGYVLIALRVVLFLNPAAQWTARAVVDDMERRADQLAVRLVGDPNALARAIEILFDAGQAQPVETDSSLERLFWKARRAGVARRCRRLRATAPGVPTGGGPLTLALAALGIALLVFFSV